MTEFSKQIFKVVWAIMSIQIPISSNLSITPWAISLFLMTIVLVVGYLKKRGQQKQ